jgi:hypothetical protein
MAVIDYAPVGDTLYNGQDLGGARIYPFSSGLAITPPSTYSDYIGSAMSLAVTPPVAALTGTAGITGSSPGVAKIKAQPFSRYSPLPWLIGALVVAVLATYHIHYRAR